MRSVHGIDLIFCLTKIYSIYGCKVCHFCYTRKSDLPDLFDLLKFLVLNRHSAEFYHRLCKFRMSIL